MFVAIDRGHIYALDWKITQYHINYIDFGLVKRGLFGTISYPIFSLLPDAGVAEHLFIISIDFLLFLIIVQLLNILIKKYLNNQIGLSVFVRTVVIFSPVGFMQMSYDIGRYDHLNFVLLIFAMYAILEKQIFLGGIILAIGVFNHEAIFFFGVPVAFAAASLTLHDFRKALSALVPPVFAIAYILFFGNLDADISLLLSSDVADGAKVWSRGVFQPNFNLSLESYLLVTFFSLAPYAFLYLAYKENELRLDLLFWSTLSPLALFVLGIDYFRWTQLIMVTVLTATFIIWKQGNRKIIKLNFVSKAVALLYVLPLGPIGIASGLPYIAKLKEIFSKLII